MNNFQKLLQNTRFYILAGALFASLFIFAYFRSVYSNDQLYFIRVQQLFGLLAAALVYVAVLITPVSKLVGQRSWVKRLLFSRRAIGVAAAYFALLHVYIALVDQVGGLSGIGLLPSRFKLSFLFGSIALLILLALAATSVDKAIKLLTFPRWKQLHRWIYLGGVLIVVHIWLIGTHVENGAVRWATYVALALLLGLESVRLGAWLQKKYSFDNQAKFAVTALLLLVVLLAIGGLPKLAPSYHAEHEQHPTEPVHTDVMQGMTMDGNDSMMMH